MSQPTEIHTLAGAYALDALTEIERAAFARHVAGCEACAIEVAELSETAVPARRGRLGSRRRRDCARRCWPRSRGPARSARGRPRAHGPRRCAAVAAVDGRRRGRRRGRPRRHRHGLGGAGAAGRRRPPAGRRAAGRPGPDRRRAGRRRRAGAARPVPRWRPDDRRGLAAPGRRRRPACRTCRRRPRQQAYQLWLIEDGTPTSAGVLAAGAGSGTAVLDTVGDAQALAVTLEPAGGSPQPTTVVLADVTLA